MRAQRHPAHAGLGTKVGRDLPGRQKASSCYLAGYNAALSAANQEGESILEQSEPRGFVPDFVDGWRFGLSLCRALGFRR